jgi:hypothetical protein
LRRYVKKYYNEDEKSIDNSVQLREDIGYRSGGKQMRAEDLLVESSDAYLYEVREGISTPLVAGRMYRRDSLDGQAAIIALGHGADPVPDQVVLDRSFAQTTGASQISADSLDTRAECPAGCALRQVGSVGVAAAGATAGDQLGLEHPHGGWRNIHVLVAERVLVVELKVRATALFASLRHDLFELVYLFDRNQRSVLRLVARLRATLLLGLLLLLAPASLLARRVARRVSRRSCQIWLRPKAALRESDSCLLSAC